MKKIFFYALSLMCALSAQAAVIHVTSDKSGSELQAAIDGATAGDEVRVQEGTYYGNFTMRQGVNVSGGWDANFETQTDYATILDAQENGRVLEQPANFATLTVWSNFTIQNGKLTAARSVPAANLGSGVALGKKGQVKHCEIRNNTFSYQGNCLGGGVGEEDTPDSNTEVMIDDCWIHHNCATHGGGVRIRGTIQNSIIENNNTKDVKAGPCGGVHLQGGRIVGSIVRGNLSGGDTGGVRAFGKCQVINCLIDGNTATGKVGGIGIESANSDVIGCTVVNNNQGSGTTSQCGISCGATAADNGTKLANNVVWGNKHNGDVQTAQVYYISHYNEANRIYNALTHQNTNNGIKLSMSNDENDTYDNNTGLAPHFADPANGDYRLTWQSPMLGRANSSIAVVTKDLDGNNRNIEGVDLGAYELPYYTLTIAAFEHATLTVGGETKTAGDYSLPKGYTTTATIEPDENYTIKSVTCDEAVLEEVEGVYTLPALSADMTLTITVQSTPTGIDDANTAVKAVKVIRNGQLLILRDGKEFNVLGSQL